MNKMNAFEFVDDIANELDIDAEHVVANIARYGLNGNKLDHRNGVWYESKEDGDFNDRISRIHNRYDENADYHRTDRCYACGEDFGDDVGDVVPAKADGEKVFICIHCHRRDALREMVTPLPAAAKARSMPGIDSWTAEEFDAKGDAWDAFLNRKNPVEYSDSYAGFQFGWNEAIAWVKGERRTLKVPELCTCAIRRHGLAICPRCEKPYHVDGAVSQGRNA